MKKLGIQWLRVRGTKIEHGSCYFKNKIRRVDNKNMDKMEETVTADEECTCGEVAQLFLEWRRGVGRARSWSQTSTTPSSVALLCKACCSPPDHESPPPFFVCSSVPHVHRLPMKVLLDAPLPLNPCSTHGGPLLVSNAAPTNLPTVPKF